MNNFLKCERWYVHGRVQRVGFRYYAMRSARRREVEGAARNQADGTVEIIVLGAKDALTAFYKDISRGPSLAHVTHIERQPAVYTDIDLETYDIIF